MAGSDDAGDGPDDGPDDDGPDEVASAGAPGEGTGDGSRKRRRRRRRRHGDAETGGPPQVQAQPQGQRPPQQPQGQRPQGQRPPPQQQRQPGRQTQQNGQRSAQGQPQGQRQESRRDHDSRRDRRDRRNDRGRDQRNEPEHEADLRGDDDDILRGDPYRTRDDDAGKTGGSAKPARSSQPTVEPATHAADEDEPAAPAIAWGSDDDSAAPTIALAPDLPIEAPAGDPDPVTYPLADGPGAQLGDDVASVVGIRFVPAGRIQWCDAGEGDFAPGERVMVDSDRGPRLAWIATPPTRRATRDRGLRRVIRRANENDLRGDRDGDADRDRALRIAKDKAAALRLPLKVFRVEKAGGKLNVYYTSDERLDLRDFVRDVGQSTGLRLELRQLGVRDEAKMVGGIGSCGLTLCCTTWLPDFVPVSIKMAKDQGLVLSPTKVSGQCGRLKCCLVYEQAGYAELRKGLPKLGKRVIAARGEGRVVEVDVLRQRVRVSYGPGDTEVLPASEVKPMFPSGNQPREPEQGDHEPDSEPEPNLPTS